MALKIPSTTPTAVVDSKDYLILSLSGGGYRGLFSAKLLENIVDSIGFERFNSNVFAITGTSVGGLIACGLTANLKPIFIRKKIEEYGPLIFCRKYKVFGQQLPLIAKTPSSLFHRTFSSMYSPEMLDAAIADILGNQKDSKLHNISKKLIVPAVCALRHRAEIYLTKGVSKVAASDLTLAEVARATSAAPTFFPPKIINKKPIIDGGLVSNAPELVAVSEILSHTQIPINKIKILSIGTGCPAGDTIPRKMKASGIGMWLASGLFEVSLAAQEELIVRQAKSIFGPRYVRLDANPGPERAKYLELDRADKDSTDVLTMMADETWEEAKRASWVNEFFPENSN